MPEFVSKFFSPFDRPRLYYALRLALSAMLALACAAALGVQNIHWAAMTVWIVAQPTRGLMIERNFYRLIGTAAGAAIAFCVLALTRDPFIVISILSFVMVACIGLGNLVNRSASYGVLLAGVTMAVVILPDIGDLAHPHDLPWSRVVATVIGVLVSMLVCGLFAPRSPRRAFVSRARLAGGDAFLWVADVLGENAAESDDPYRVEHKRRLIREIAEVEGMIDMVAAGSPGAHRRMRFLRVYLLELVNVMAITRTLAWRRSVVGGDAELAARFRALAQAVHAEGDLGPAKQLVQQACRQHGGAGCADAGVLAALAAAVQRTVTALEDFERDEASLERSEYSLHRDMPGAVRAAVRAWVSFTVVAFVWHLTGWSGGPYTLMGMSIFLTMFSAMPHPQRALTGVFIGTCLGTIAAIACRWLMLEYAVNYAHVLLILLPFVVAGALARVHPLTDKPAIDYGMSLFVTSQPMLPLHGGLEVSYSVGLSMIVAIAIVILAYRFIFPVKPARTARDLEKALFDDLRKLSAQRDAKETGQRLTRMLHRVLCLAMVAEARRGVPIDTVVSPISAAHSIRQLQADMTGGSLPEAVVVQGKKALQAIADRQASADAVRDNLHDVIVAMEKLQAGPDILATVKDIRAALSHASGLPPIPASANAG